MTTIAEAIKTIIEWASCHDELEEIYLIGSQSERHLDDEIAASSDIDFAIVVEEGEVPDWIYSELAKIGLKIGKLIHPLVLCKKDIEIKKSITNYQRAISSGMKIYRKCNKIPKL